MKKHNVYAVGTYLFRGLDLAGFFLAVFGGAGAAIILLTASSNLTPCNRKSTGFGISYLALLAGSLAFCFGYSTSNQMPESPMQENQSGGKGGKPSDEPPKAEGVVTRLPFDVPPSPTDCSNPNRETNSVHQSKPNWVEISILILEIFGVLGLVYYCVINQKELIVFDSERKTMEREFQANQTAAFQQLTEMQWQRDEMKNSRVLDERAWVAPFEMSVERGITDTNYFFLKLEFKNTGKTPALNVSETHGFTVGFNNVPTNDAVATTNSMMLAPDSITFIRSQAIYYIEVENFIASDAPVCLYGKISYDDIFGNHHWTQFCWSMEDGKNFRPSPVHNSTDDAARANQN